MKIALIEPIGGHGGMDYYDYGLAYGLGCNDLDVLFYTCDKTYIRCFRSVDTILMFKKIWDTNIIIKTFQYLKGHFMSFKDAKKKKVRLIHLHFFTFRFIDYLILIIAKKMNFIIIVTVHDINSFNKKANLSIERGCYKLIDGAIVHNNSSYNDLNKKNITIKKITIIPHGNYNLFIKKIPLKRSDNVFTLLFFGQIKKVKGLDILLNSIKLVIDKGYKIKLIIAGKVWKSDLDYYINLIKELNIQSAVETNFRYIPDEEIASFFSKADLVVLPYLEIYQSGVLLLTMSYGRPVLCSDLNAFKEIIIDKENGFLFENKNKDSLANSIIDIIDNQCIVDKVVKNADRLIESRYNWLNIGKQTADLYHSLLD
ncbi:GDP-mannose:glycolipid 4-beta-D-mannosyltransferase [termite gut metagenome]|uniref:GDP-mannose:glycolipid 4-beta-D-mannosyltransferase n=1 Tax=termite gut metagenome TaxID=433724 RepID=A0A5J4S9E2_9ZZZZ